MSFVIFDLRIKDKRSDKTINIRDLFVLSVIVYFIFIILFSI